VVVVVETRELADLVELLSDKSVIFERVINTVSTLLHIHTLDFTHMTDRQTDRQSYLQSQQHDNGTHIEVHSQQQVSNTVATLIHTANTHSSPASTDTPTRHTHTQLSSRITTADLM